MGKILLKKSDLNTLAASVRASGALFVAPVMDAGRVVYKECESAEEITGDYIIPVNTYKEWVFPQTEVIATFSVKKDGVDLEGTDLTPPEAVVFGARACEAASLASLRSVFTWGGDDDEFYTRREDRMVVITIGCTAIDDECFCTTVDLSPASTAGSDLYLRETTDGDYLVTAITKKGEEFLKAHKEAFKKGNAEPKLVDLMLPGVIEGIDREKIGKWLSNTDHYQDPLWPRMARKCFGCGACTFSCPTCHCFDITDEGTAFGGERRKNWDACQFEYFTMHASGHNPRDTQYKRWRNRFMCKFRIYPEKFKTTGCVGCGRCIRVCPVRLDITEVMEEITRAAK